MKAKLISAAVTAALLGFATASWAQSSSSSSSPDKAKSPSSASSGASAVPAKCADMKGAEREKCITAEKKNGGSSSAGSTKPKSQ